MSVPCDMEIVMQATSPRDFGIRLHMMMEDYEDPEYKHATCDRCGSTILSEQEPLHNGYHRTLTFVQKLAGLSMDTLLDRINTVEEAMKTQAETIEIMLKTLEDVAEFMENSQGGK